MDVSHAGKGLSTTQTATTGNPRGTNGAMLLVNIRKVANKDGDVI